MAELFLAGGEGDMKASIVIPTYNRAGLLRRTLASLARQTGADGDFEVIVADDGSSDDTAAVAGSFGGPFPLRYYHQADEGYRAAAARNGGARLARHEVLLFLDSGAGRPCGDTSGLRTAEGAVGGTGRDTGSAWPPERAGGAAGDCRVVRDGGSAATDGAGT